MIDPCPSSFRAMDPDDKSKRVALVSARVTAQTWRQLQSKARSEGRSPSEILRNLLEEYLKP